MGPLIGILFKLRRDGTKKVNNTFFSEVVVYDKLGLKQEDENDAKSREEACRRSGSGSLSHDFDDELPCDDQVPHEMSSFLDWLNPIMELGSRYKDMATFRLAMRQFAIKKILN
jgi:hypothetical protein